MSLLCKRNITDTLSMMPPPMCLFYKLFSFKQGSTLITAATLFFPWPLSKTFWLLCRPITPRQSHWPTQTLSTSMTLGFFKLLLLCFFYLSWAIYVLLHSKNVLCFCRDYSVSCSGDIFIDRENPLWYYYFLCGVKGIQVGDNFSLTVFSN